jgi:hypothetical protein
MNFSQPHLKSLLKPMKLETIKETDNCENADNNSAPCSSLAQPMKLHTPLRAAIQSRLFKQMTPAPVEAGVPKQLSPQPQPAVAKLQAECNLVQSRRMGTPLRKAIESKLPNEEKSVAETAEVKEPVFLQSKKFDSQLMQAINLRRKSYSSRQQPLPELVEDDVPIQNSTTTPGSHRRGLSPSPLVVRSVSKQEPILATSPEPMPAKQLMFTPLRKAIESRRRSFALPVAADVAAAVDPVAAQEERIKSLKSCFLEAIRLRRQQQSLQATPQKSPAHKNDCSATLSPFPSNNSEGEPEANTNRLEESCAVDQQLCALITRSLRLQNLATKKSREFRSFSRLFLSLPLNSKTLSSATRLPLRQRPEDFTRVTRGVAVARNIDIPALPEMEWTDAYNTTETQNLNALESLSQTIAGTCAQICVDSVACELELRVSRVRSFLACY